MPPPRVEGCLADELLLSRVVLHDFLVELLELGDRLGHPPDSRRPVNFFSRLPFSTSSSFSPHPLAHPPRSLDDHASYPHRFAPPRLPARPRLLLSSGVGAEAGEEEEWRNSGRWSWSGGGGGHGGGVGVEVEEEELDPGGGVGGILELELKGSDESELQGSWRWSWSGGGGGGGPDWLQMQANKNACPSPPFRDVPVLVEE
eukprot:1633899-Pyramimonas_sp.AAC.1